MPNNNFNQTKKILTLIVDAQKKPFEGLGKPEVLKHNLADCWSRRIDDINKLNYQKKKQNSTPRKKRMTREGRMNSGKEWVKTFNGKNIIKGYAKWFGVDSICAITELKIIGVLIPENLENQIRKSYKSRIELKNKRKKQKELERMEWDDNFEFIDEDSNVNYFWF